MTPTPTTRADLHCHSAASQTSRLGVQTSLGLPECATPPDEVYELAKARGMDFVTITDHDTISGALEIAGRPGAFVSEELTARFRGEPQAVHVLCWGIEPGDHEWLQAHADDVETCAEYLHGNGIACALAHPFYAVAAPLTTRHRRRLAQLFPVWETRNGSRAPELNLPATIYIETRGGAGVGGSDDHAGIDVGRTWTETPPASTPGEFLRRIRRGEASAGGEEGGADKWAHMALALAIRALGTDDAPAPDPRRLMSMVEHVMSQGDARSGPPAADLGPGDARALLHAWIGSLELGLDGPGLLRWMQADGFSHAVLARRARRAHERSLRRAAERVVEAAGAGSGYREAATGVFGACIPSVPYAAAAAFLGRERARLDRGDRHLPRIAIVADGVGHMHGVTHTLDEIQERGVPGYQVEVVGTDPRVDRRLPSVADVEMPFYAGLRVGVPSVPATVDALVDGRYEAVHLCSPGPAGVAAALIARIMGRPLIGSYHTELGIYAGLRSGDPLAKAGMDAGLSAFYGLCDVVLSPSPSADASLAELGIDPALTTRWGRGVDLGRFSPDLRTPGLLPGGVNVLYAGRLTREKGIDLLADAFLLARERDPRLHLVLAGGGPEERMLRRRLGASATFLGWLEAEELARVYASADVFLFGSRTDTFGQVILEAQASGLPVVAVGEGGPASLVEHGRTGLLSGPGPRALADRLVEMAASEPQRRRLAGAARRAVAERSWERALDQLGQGYERALRGPRRSAVRAA